MFLGVIRLFRAATLMILHCLLAVKGSRDHGTPFRQSVCFRMAVEERVMGHQVTNKHKQAKFSDEGEPPSRWEKRMTARLLRREGLESEGESSERRSTKPRSLDRRASRKQRDRCPVCEAKLRKIGKGTRYQRNCEACGAVHQKHLFCPSCSTHRVWAGRLGRWCKGCGHSVES